VSSANLHLRSSGLFAILGRKGASEPRKSAPHSLDMKKRRSQVKSRHRQRGVLEKAVDMVAGGGTRKIFLILVLTLIFLSLPGGGVAYEKNDFGLGIILGCPTGLSAKLWLSKSSAFDAATAWSFSD
jgi:hypothetical protein